MISRTLVRLIDQAIAPAILLLCTRIISVILISYLGEINFVLSNKGFYFNSPEEYLYINSYSTLAMIVVLAVGLLYILLKAFIFHDTHVSPGLTAKLFHFRLTTLIQNSFELYSQGAIWLVYLYLISVVSLILSLFGLIYIWIFYVSLVLSVISTVVLIFDIENEIELKRHGDDFIEDDTPVELY
jgi:hypothetical protein